MTSRCNAGINDGIDVRHNTWYLNSKTFGRVWMGLTGGASEGITETNLAATKDVLKYSDIEDTGLGLFTRLVVRTTRSVASSDPRRRRPAG